MEATYPVIKSDDALPPLIAEGLYSFSIGGSERVGVDMARRGKSGGPQLRKFCTSVALLQHIRDEGAVQFLRSAGRECVEQGVIRCSDTAAIRQRALISEAV